MRHLLTILVVVGLLVVLSVAVTQLTAPTVASSTAAATLARANQLYENGQYAAAAVLYDQLVSEGINNSAVYYNLGNAQLQTGQYDVAVDSYLAAQALAPRDADIAHNLALARQQAGIVAPASAGWPLVNLFSRDELAIGALLLWGGIAVMILALRRRFVPGVFKPLLAVLVFALVVTGALYLGQIAAEARQNHMVGEASGGPALIEEAAES